MHKEQFKEWVKEKKVRDLIDKNAKHFEFILNDCLGVGKEEVLIVGDYGGAENIIAPILVGCYLKARGKRKVNLIIQEVKSKNQQADWKVLEAMDKLPEDPKQLPSAFKKHLVDSGMINPVYENILAKVLKMKKLLT